MNKLRKQQGIFGDLLNPQNLFGNSGMLPTLLGGVSAYNQFGQAEKQNKMIKDMIAYNRMKDEQDREERRNFTRGQITDRNYNASTSYEPGQGYVKNPNARDLQDVLSSYGY